MEDIFSQFGDIFGGAFGNMGGFESAGGRTRRRQRRGTDLRIKIKMTLAEIATGVTKTQDTHPCARPKLSRHRSQGRHSVSHLSDL